jgi:hypothetical protein
MPYRSKSLAVFLLVLLLLPAVLQAAEPRQVSASGSFAWELLVQTWSFLTAVWSENGCGIDPNGRCAAVTVDNGCGADPNGRCLPGQSTTVTVDNGCHAAPSGLCRD